MAGYFDATTLDGWLQKDAIPYFFTRNFAFKEVFENGNWEIQHGKTGVQWNVRLSGATMQSYGKFGTFVAAEGGDFATAYLPWGRLVSTMAISGLEMERQGKAGDFMAGTLTPMHGQILSDLRDDFAFNLAVQFADGDGADLNGGGGVGILGYKQSVSTTPSTGTYANISRVTVTDHRNQQFSAAAGPSTSAAQDAWWAFLNAKYSGSRMMGPKGTVSPDIMIANQGPIIMIQNKGFAQNTSVGADVNGVKSIEGIKIAPPDDNETADVVRFLTTKVWKIISTQAKSKFYNLREITNIPNHVHENDAALVLRTPDFQLVDTFPKAQVAVTAFV